MDGGLAAAGADIGRGGLRVIVDGADVDGDVETRLGGGLGQGSPDPSRTPVMRAAPRVVFRPRAILVEPAELE